MKDTGKETANTVMDWRRGLMEHTLEDSMLKDRNKELVNSLGPMEQLTTANFLKTTLKDRVSTTGLTAAHTKASGQTTKCRAKTASSPGQMAEDMKETISMIRKKVMGFSTGRMEENMMENGSMGSSMGKRHIHLVEGKQNKGSGLMERGLIGHLI